MVDMSLGVCSCEFGKDGSPCKHQYLLWATNLANSLNFVPVSSPELRQKLALVALGETLPIMKYTTLRDGNSAPNNIEVQAGPTEKDGSGIHISDSIQEQQSDHSPSSVDGGNEDTQMLISNAQNTLLHTCNLLAAKVDKCQDPKLASGVLKFSGKLQKLLTSSVSGNLISALYTFGSTELNKSKNGKKIKVQPNRKRKSGNGSRQAVAKGRSSELVALCPPTKKGKRAHSLSVAVEQNTSMPKKSGSHVMKSKTRNTVQ